MGNEVKETKPTASSGTPAATPNSNTAGSANTTNNNSSQDSTAVAITGHVATISTAVSNVTVAGINLAAEERKLQGKIEDRKTAEANAKAAETNGKNALVLQQDKQKHDAAEAEKQRKQELDVLKEKHTEAAAVRKDAREIFDEENKRENRELDAVIAFNDQSIAIRGAALDQVKKEGKITPEMLQALSMFAQPQRRNGPQYNVYSPVPAAAPQPKGPSI